RACRYAPAPPFHLSSYGEPSKTKPKVRSANHQQNSLFTGNKKETTSTFLEVLSFFAERKAHRQRSSSDMRIIDTMS
ncbi:hypothetical protein, partial [Oceaniferula marina]|uniref:hypothetical protein n=1 Tax=Oceaniferula marina TaxID=2748318 RepID=UPI001D042A6A